MTEPVRYKVALRQLDAHLFDVEAVFPSTAATVDLWLPAWTPGSYLIRELARHVQDVTAADDAGRPLSVERRDKNTWRISPGSARTIRVAWRVYGNDLTVRTSHLDATHGFFNGTCLFLTSDAHRALPCRVSIEAPSGWRTFTSLKVDAADFCSDNYDDLVDSPFEIGPHEPIPFAAGGVEHRLVVWGHGNHDRVALAGDLTRICEAEVAMFRGSPCRSYTFILLLSDKGRGGLEHAESTALLYPRFAFRPKKAYEDFLSLAAHEYFHLWNVKRIKPRAFVPYAYDRENYTTLLWAMEGITSYYDTLLLRRAGLIPAKRYLEKVGEVMTTLARTPGRAALSLADASLLTWVKYYRPDENAPNSQVSYYVKGELVGLLLDLLIRQKTRGAKSLDDVMRLLWKQYGNGQGTEELAVEKAAAEIAGESLAPFFDRAIRSTQELDFSLLQTAGLAVRTRPSAGATDKGGTPPPREEGTTLPKSWLGLTVKPVESRVVVASVLGGSPAAAGGIYAEDEIVAVDGFRAEPSTWTARLQDDHQPGDRVVFTVFRRDQLIEVAVTLGPAPADAWYLELDPGATETAKQIYQQWLGEPFPSTQER
jgi:predicted metalloprotease with PDZ domain